MCIRDSPPLDPFDDAADDAGQLVEHASSLHQGARLDQSSVRRAAAKTRSFSRPATSLDTTRSCGSRQIPRPGTDEKFWNTTTRSFQSAGSFAVVMLTPWA